MVEHFTWPDKIAAELAPRGTNHVCHGMWTPSGYFHIGNARNELMAPLLVNEALNNAGLKSVFNLFIDDFDDLDKIPRGISVPEGFEKNMGRPLYEIPSPVPEFKSWSSYFSSELLEVLDDYGAMPNVFSSYEQYHKGTYDKAIKIVLDKAREARNIWVKITKTQKPENWIPVMPVCENCKRASTTTALEWDGSRLKYSCTQNRDYAEACKYEGEFEPVKGRVKLPWRLHWPATWYTFGVTMESGGKDHFAAGGSVDTGRAFCREIFGVEPPYLLRGEFVTVAGKKISGSKGGVVSIKDWLEIADPELLRFIYASYQPSTVIELDLSSQKFFLLADRYDEAERVYFGAAAISEKRTAQLRRQYELSQVHKIPSKAPVRVGYATLAMLLQVVPDKSAKSIGKMLAKMGTLKEELSAENERRLAERIRHAGNWLDKYATEDMRIRLNESPPVIGLDENRRAALDDLAGKIKKADDEAELQSAVYDIARKNNLEPRDFFRLLYGILIGKESGPRLGAFILAAGKEKVSRLLEEAA